MNAEVCTGTRRRIVEHLSVLSILLAAQLVPLAAHGTIAQEPLTVARAVRPIVMLALSNDHQLYKRGYDDLTDLDNDGAIETTYDNDYDYYGYFGAGLCYRYDDGAGNFEPIGEATDHTCAADYWSGNFLNWASMTRMDLLRRVLYGGRRITDTTSATVLERAVIPADFHAFAKVFAPAGGAAEMALYTPFSTTAITLCNVTDAISGESQDLNTSLNPPVIRAAAGTWQLWATGEASEIHLPCAWDDDSSVHNVAPNVGGGEGLGTFNARVAVCVAGLEEPHCKQYPAVGSVKKPTGILQQFGDAQELRFGMLSGSYGQNASGGVLRRNSGYTADNDVAFAAADEVDLDDGTFTGNAGIVETVDSFRINAYDFASHYYNDACVSPESADVSDGSCTNWGNPVSEMLLETLRYIAGKGAPTGAFNTDDSDINSAFEPVSWEDPITFNEWCTKPNILVVTGGVNSFDRDELAHDIAGLDITAETDAVGAAEGVAGDYVLGGNATSSDGNCYIRRIDALSEAFGVCPTGGKLKGGWDVAGMSYFAHVNDFRSDRAEDQFVATRAIDMGDGVPKLGRIRNGSVVLSGGATITPICMTNADPDAEVPKIRDLVDDEDNFYPRDTDPHGWGQCGLWGVLPYNLVYDDEGYLLEGDLYAFWEDTALGSDSELDAISRIHFCVGSPNCDVTGDYWTDRYTLGWEDAAGGGNYTLPESLAKDDEEIRVTASVVQVYSDRALSFGFMIDGLFRDGQPQATADHCDNGLGNGDGIYLEEAIPGTVITDDDGGEVDKKDKKDKKKDVDVVSGSFSIYTPDLGIGSVNEEREQRFCGRRFKPGDDGIGDPAPMLKPPLWFATKYGGFTDSNDNDVPDLEAEWDSDGDGNPDGYHMLYAPQDIGESFDAVLDLIAGVSSSSSVVANTLVLKTGTYIYQGRFDSSDWSGDLVAYPVNMDGSLGTIAWQAKSAVDAQFTGTGWSSRRVVFTSASKIGGGVPFLWDYLTEDQKNALDRNPLSDVDDDLGPDRLDFLRGDSSNELQQGGGFRDREHLLGDIVNSDPLFVGQPPFNYPDSLERYANYSGFVATERDAMIYVGGNDGLLHGFDVDNGEERMAYVPRAVYERLSWLTALDYERNHRFFVDGGVIVGDVVLNWWGYTGDGWHSVLVGTLGAGGKGIYALDVTDPDDFQETLTAASDIVMWDFTASDVGFEDLGYTFAAPAVIRLRHYLGLALDSFNLGTWAAAIGNGYESANGSANLYLIAIGSGVIIADVQVDPGPGNGLSSVAPVDIDGDYNVDFIYAGDLKGNIWRFEPASSGSAWQVSFSGAPLFRATDAAGHEQPITTRPAVFAHPNGGTIVVFGTGKFHEIEDATPNPSRVNSIYGVWDRLDGTAEISRDHLLEQSFFAGGSAHGYDLRVSTDHALKWYTGEGKPSGSEDPPEHLGWYLDLLDPMGEDGPTARGELVAAELKVRGERIIVTSMIPSEEPCDYGGEGWLTELTYVDGRPPVGVLFDLNDDGVFDDLDTLDVVVDDPEPGAPATRQLGANAKASLIGIIQQPAIIGAGESEYKFASGGMPADVEVTRENPGSAAGGRTAWGELQ
jgi:type IV pilus assembly protein PilY1